MRRDSAEHAADPLSPLEHKERAIPPSPQSLPAEESRPLEAHCLEVLGSALFDEVAQLVQPEMRL